MLKVLHTNVLPVTRVTKSTVTLSVKNNTQLQQMVWGLGLHYTNSVICTQNYSVGSNTPTVNILHVFKQGLQGFTTTQKSNTVYQVTTSYNLFKKLTISKGTKKGKPWYNVKVTLTHQQFISCYNSIYQVIKNSI